MISEIDDEIAEEWERSLDFDEDFLDVIEIPQFSEALEKVIQNSGLKLDEFDDPAFDAVEYLNRSFPDEESLSEVEGAVHRVDLLLQRTNQALIREVVAQSQGGGGAEALDEVEAQIGALVSKVGDVKDKAEESERMVQDICSDIQSLDYAKKNLTSCLNVMQRLKMFVNAADKLEGAVSRRQYQEAAQLLLAIGELYTLFEEHADVPKVQRLRRQVDQSRLHVYSQVEIEFESLGASTHVNHAHLAAGCQVVEALGEEKKSLFMATFCRRRLDEYRSAFAAGKDAGLERLERRFFWLQKELARYDEEFSRVFPSAWKFDEYFCYEFCVLTHQQVSELLELQASQAGGIGVEQLTKALGKTLEFEKKLSKRFQPTEEELRAAAQRADDDDDDADDLGAFGDGSSIDLAREEEALIDREVGEAPPDENPNSKEAIERRLRRFQTQLARRKQRRSAALYAAVLRFRGVVSECFNPHMGAYIASLDDSLAQERQRALQKERWDGGGEAQRVLESARDLLVAMGAVLKQCAALARGQPLFDLYRKVFRKHLKGYAKALGKRLPALEHLKKDIVSAIESSSSSSSSRVAADDGQDHASSSSSSSSSNNNNSMRFSDRDEQAALLIINTAEYCAEQTGIMADKVRSLIDRAFLPEVDVEREREIFETLSTLGLQTLAAGLENRMAPMLRTISTRNWGAVEAVGDQSDYVTQCSSLLHLALPKYRTWLRSSYFSYLCDAFVTSFTRRVLHALRHCRSISEIGAEQLLFDMTALRIALLDAPQAPYAGAGADGEKPPGEKTEKPQVSRRYAKIVLKEMGRCEALLKVVIAPSETLLESYRTLVPDGSEEDFQRILELRGHKRDIQGMLQRYRSVKQTTLSQVGSFFESLK